MSKKKHKKRKDAEGGAPAAQDAEELEAEPLSRRGKRTIFWGILLLVAGFFLLTFTDPEGRNWASFLSPLLILGAYGVIATGIFLPDPEEPPEPQPPGPPPQTDSPDTAKSQPPT